MNVWVLTDTYGGVVQDVRVFMDETTAKQAYVDLIRDAADPSEIPTIVHMLQLEEQYKGARVWAHFNDDDWDPVLWATHID